jgi:tRNA 2-thiocytidine biosynthesis protein TtcA
MRKREHELVKGSDVAWKVFRKVGRALREYRQLSDGCHVLVALSGGKDSMCMLEQLVKWIPRLPFPVQLSAVHVRTDASDPERSNDPYMQAFCDGLGVPLHFIYTEVLSTAGPNGVDCYHCARRRRIMLFRLANTIGANRIALGHHMDDIVETTLMNMCFNGTFSTMEPRMELFEGRTVIIRPLAKLLESEIIAYAEERGFWRQPCGCSYAKHHMRGKMKRMVATLEELYPDVRQNIFASTQRAAKPEPLG